MITQKTPWQVSETVRTREPGRFDHEAFQAHRHSRLSQPPLERALVSSQADFPQHHRVQRWWDNTLLTNETLWRWDPGRQELARPA